MLVQETGRKLLYNYLEVALINITWSTDLRRCARSIEPGSVAMELKS